ncbi:hypothetical protein ACFL0M_01205 [Thermodesulfobacteriota bacterium]
MTAKFPTEERYGLTSQIIGNTDIISRGFRFN